MDKAIHIDELGRILYAIHLTDYDDDNSDEESEDIEVHNKAIAESIIRRHTYSDANLAYGNTLIGNIVLLLGRD